MVIQVIKNISYIKRNTSQVLNEFSMSIVLIASYGNICATWFGRFHFKCYTNRAVIADDITSQAFTMFSFVVRTPSISVCLFFFFQILFRFIRFNNCTLTISPLLFVALKNL